jgi:hypothetical protein
MPAAVVKKRSRGQPPDINGIIASVLVETILRGDDPLIQYHVLLNAAPIK